LTRALNPTNPSDGMWGTKETMGLSLPTLLHTDPARQGISMSISSLSTMLTLQTITLPSTMEENKVNS
jgi:hypothetical protein